VTRVAENTTGLAFESGPYFVLYEITDGGLDAALETAITERALSHGWKLVERTEDPDTITLRFLRDDLEALVRVWLDQDPTSASITVLAAAD
jgi:hypothetical protein